MAEPWTDEAVRLIIGGTLTQAEVSALVQAYATIARDVAAFPAADLKLVQPPLHAVAGPRV